MGKYEKKTPFWKRIGAGILEVLGEFLIVGIFFSLGAGACWLFGKTDAVESIDGDALCVIGIAVFVAIFYAGSAIVRWIKKRRKMNDTENSETKESF